tara:strand:- start:237 stop:440 length:204 start_codon:yes stop_codon:yes gene_type:complete
MSKLFFVAFSILNNSCMIATRATAATEYQQQFLISRKLITKENVLVNLSNLSKIGHNIFDFTMGYRM